MIAVAILAATVWLLLIAVILVWTASARAAGERVDEVMAAKFSRPVGEAAAFPGEPPPAGAQPQDTT